MQIKRLSPIYWGRKLQRSWSEWTINKNIRSQGVIIDNKAKFYGMPIISMSINSEIIIGNNCTLCSDSKYTALGVNHPVIMRTLRPNSKIIIGKNTGISGASICSAIKITIGEECLLGANVIIADTDFHTIKPYQRRFNSNYDDISSKEVIIENNVFIGANSIILKGVTIGENSVVGAGSIVTKNVRRNSIVAGNPAIEMRKNI